jgi:hypothetical protein
MGKRGRLTNNVVKYQEIYGQPSKAVEIPEKQEIELKKRCDDPRPKCERFDVLDVLQMLRRLYGQKHRYK